MPSRSAKVLIVGGGWAGLVTLNSLLRSGFTDVTVLEASDTLTIGTAYKGLALQVPWSQAQLPDFPLSATSIKPSSLHPTAEEMTQYAFAYVQAFGLMRHIRFGCHLTNLSPCSGQRWLVSYTDSSTQDKPQVQLEAAFVVVCTGVSSTPHLPHYPGMRDFQGCVLHSSELKDMNLAKGKRVVLMGSGRAPADLVVQWAVAQQAESVVMLNQRVRWPLLERVCGVSMRRILLSRCGCALGRSVPYYTASKAERCLSALARPFKAAAWWGIKRYFTQKLDINQLNLPLESLAADLHWGGHLPIKQWREMVHSGKLAALEGRIRYLQPDGIVLDTGTSLACDMLVMCTGYSSSLRFLDPRVTLQLHAEEDGLYLYRQMVHPDVKNLAFIGTVVTSNAYMVTTSLQARWLVAALLHEVSIPPSPVMADDIRQQRDWRRRVMKPQANRAGLLMPYTQMYHDQLLKDMGARTNRKGWNLFGECFSPYSVADYGEFLGSPTARNRFKVQLQEGHNADQDYSTRRMSVDYSVRPGHNPYKHARHMLALAQARATPDPAQAGMQLAAIQGSNTDPMPTASEPGATSLYASHRSIERQGSEDDLYHHLHQQGQHSEQQHQILPTNQQQQQQQQQQQRYESVYGQQVVEQADACISNAAGTSLYASPGIMMRGGNAPLTSRVSLSLNSKESVGLSARDSMALPLPALAVAASQHSSLFGGLPVALTHVADAATSAEASAGSGSRVSKPQDGKGGVSVAQQQPSLAASQTAQHSSCILLPGTATAGVRPRLPLGGVECESGSVDGCDTPPVPVAPTGAPRGHARRASNLCLQRRLSDSSVASSGSNPAPYQDVGGLPEQQQTMYDRVRVAMQSAGSSCTSFTEGHGDSSSLPMADGSYENPFAERAARASVTSQHAWRRLHTDHLPSSPASPAANLLYPSRPGSPALVHPLLGSPAGSTNSPRRLAAQQLWQDSQMLELLAAPPPCISSKKVLGVNTGMRTAQAQYPPSLLQHAVSGLSSPAASPYHPLHHANTTHGLHVRAGSSALSRQQSEAGIASPVDSAHTGLSNDSNGLLSSHTGRRATCSTLGDAHGQMGSTGAAHGIPAARVTSLTRFAKSYSSSGEIAVPTSASGQVQASAVRDMPQQTGRVTRQITAPSGAFMTDMTATPSRLSCASSVCVPPAAMSAAACTAVSTHPAGILGISHAQGSGLLDQRQDRTSDYMISSDDHALLNTAYSSISTASTLQPAAGLFDRQHNSTPAFPGMDGRLLGAARRSVTSEIGIMPSGPGFQPVPRQRHAMHLTTPGFNVMQDSGQNTKKTAAMGAQEVFQRILHQGHALWAMHHDEAALPHLPLAPERGRFQPQLTSLHMTVGDQKGQANTAGKARSKTQPGEAGVKPAGTLRGFFNKLTHSVGPRD